jgi:DNA-binding transcriptional ArsR family regulator
MPTPASVVPPLRAAWLLDGCRHSVYTEIGDRGVSPPLFRRAAALGVVLTYNQMVVNKEPIRDDEKAADLLFAALADRTRRDIFRRAREGRLSVSALAREYPISLTAVQKHVDVLERAELVSKHRVGRESIVRAETDALKRAHAALERLESEWRDRVERIDHILDEDKGDNRCPSPM